MAETGTDHRHASVPALLVAASLLALAIAPPAAAEMTRHRTVFNVVFGALPVGKATFDIRFDDAAYELDGSGRTVGVVELFAPGKGTVASTGRIVGDHIVAVSNTINYAEKKKRSTFRMEFDEGEVSSVSYEPDTRKNKNGPKWVPVTPDQLRSVIDPASGLIIPVDRDRANDPRAVCNRVLNVYDGDTRYDIALKYKATKTVSTDGYRGFAYVCQLRYVPVSGHRKKQRNVEYMSRNEDMEVWLAPMARSNLYTPIRIEVPTWVGRVSAVPAYFGAAAD
ncbi:MAG: hypothetical protein BroJett030_03080 [Alphaproteobacteria bacterium]|nr:MAG: hypothetical protein BroJett030_03080 [Alphaproteobacteria bacterium]